MDRRELESREVKDVAETEGARRAAGVSAGAHPDPEVPERAKRRQFSAEYKLRILREADACKASRGETRLRLGHGRTRVAVLALGEVRNGGAARPRSARSRRQAF